MNSGASEIRLINIRNTAETQLWNDAVSYFRESVVRGEELVIPLLPGRTLYSMYASMQSAFKRRGLDVTVKQCTNNRWRYFQRRWSSDTYGKPCIVVIHKGTYRTIDAKQHNFFDHFGGAVVYVNDEPFYGTYVGEEGDKLVFSLIWNDDEKIVKFGKAFCNKSGQYAWIVKG